MFVQNSLEVNVVVVEILKSRPRGFTEQLTLATEITY